MLSRLDPVLKKRTQELVFIEMKPGVPLGWNGFVFPEGTPIPMVLTEIMGEITSHDIEHLSSVVFVEGMIRVLGIDSDTPLKSVYTNALKAYQPDMLQVILEKGIALASDNEVSEALLLFRAAVMLEPDNADVLYNYGRALSDLVREHEGTKLENLLTDEAIEAFERLSELMPDLAQPYYHLGFLYANKKAYIRAVDCWHTALTKELTEDQEFEIKTLLVQLDDKRIYEEGYSFVLKGYYQEGLERLTSIEDKYPEWWNLVFFIGLAYKGLEQYGDAVSCFLRVVQLNPTHSESFNEMGICYLMLQMLKEAEDSFAKGIALAPDSGELLCNMGIAQIEKGNLTLAEKFLIEAVKKAPEDEICKAWLEKVRKEIPLREPVTERLN